MRRFNSILITICTIFVFGSGGTILADNEVLEPADANTLVFLWDFSKLKRDHFITAAEYWDEPVFTNYAANQQRHVEILEDLIAYYNVEEPAWFWGNYSAVLWENEELKSILTLPGPWNFSRSEYFHINAYLEEMNIRDLRQAILDTDEQLLIDTYTNQLAGAYVQLLGIASLLFEDPFDYGAQLLNQEDVDAILADPILEPGFEINAGLNDAWYNLATKGQGFFISVYEEQGLVFLSWLTFATELHEPDANTKLGSTCQRWLTALGNYDGAQADLVVYSSSGGLFDESLPTPEVEPIGSIVLQFEDCDTGSVTYDLPGIGETGSIPIQRLAPDNIALCEVKAYPTR